MTERIALLGGGRIGEALLAGLLAKGKAASTLVVAEKFAERRSELETTYGVRTVANVGEAIATATVVILAVKPADVDAVLAEIVARDAAAEQLLITVVAGLPLAKYEALLPAGTPVIRTMPNTPMVVNEGMTGISLGRYATAAHEVIARELLETVGKVLIISESQMDAVTAVSGSGPAYVFLMAEAMIDAGVGLGLTRAQATLLAGQTIKGAGTMLADSLADPVELRAGVTSPGGTTAEAIRELEKNGLRTGFYEAMRACAIKSAEIGKGASGIKPADKTNI